MADSRHLGEIGKEIDETLGLELRIKIEFFNTGRGNTWRHATALFEPERSPVNHKMPRNLGEPPRLRWEGKGLRGL